MNSSNKRSPLGLVFGPVRKAGFGLVVLGMLLMCCDIGRAAERGLAKKDGNSEKSVSKCLMPLDFGPGFGSTWFSCRSIDTKISRVRDTSFEALRIEFLESTNLQWIDHVPIWLDSGDYDLAFETHCNVPDRGFRAKLISMTCDKKGRFSDVMVKRLKTGKHGKEKYVIDFKGVPRGLYILRFEFSDFPRGSSMDLCNVQMVSLGSAFENRTVQIAPDLDDVLYRKDEPVRVGARVYLTENETFELKYQVKGSGGEVVQEGILGTFKERGFFLPQTTFVPKDFDLYVVTYFLDGRPGLLTQKAFSVLPEGDSDFMGLHAYPKNRGREFLVLGRRLGFKHYRDHDMGNFTRWSKIQPGEPSRFGPGKPPPFVWFGDADIKFLVKDLGYSYLGVLYDTPAWARDEARSIPGFSRFVPHLSDWRRYVKNVVKRYSFDSNLISSWEIWNEGKGVSGAKLNDPTIYVELLNSAIEEIKTLKKAHPGVHVDIVAFAGFNHKAYWTETFKQVKGFDVASVHWKASSYRDTYHPAKRNDRESREKYSRSGWLNTARTTIDRFGDGQDIWETEGGLLNQVYPIYDFVDIPGDAREAGFPLSDRSADRRYNPTKSNNWGPLNPLEAASIVAKQTIAHKICGIDRCYMYYFSNRNFVSSGYAEQMLEYDGTLMPYTHAFVFACKFLDGSEYKGREWLSEGRIVKENFWWDSGKKRAAVLWNEAGVSDEIFIDENSAVSNFMGRNLKYATKGTKLSIGENPIFMLSQ